MEDGMKDTESGSGVEEVLGTPIPRRTFLKVAGAGALGITSAYAGLLGAAQQARAQAPDPLLEKALELELDAERIFRFVSDEIRYEPYAGVLRGARGTLQTLAGNAADKSLLLASLLDAALVPYRFATGPLEPAAADALAAAARVDAASARERALAVGAGQDGGGAGRSEALPPDLSAYAGQLRAIIDEQMAAGERMVEDGIRTILDALGDALPVEAADDDSVVLPELERSQHTWVRIASGADWIDADPSLPGSVLGAAIASRAAEADALPDELRHRFELEVVVERVSGEEVVREIILDHVAFADELAGTPVALFHEKPGDLAGVGVAIGNLVSGGIDYQPILQVGDGGFVGLAGVTFPTEDGGLIDELGGEVGRDGDTLAEWLETRVVSPDGVTTSATRTLFDRVPPEMRASGAIDVAAIPPVELADLGEETRGEFLPLRILHFLSVATGATSSTVLDAIDPDDESPWPLHVRGDLYHLSRDSAGAMWGIDHGTCTFVDRPNVASFGVAFMPRPETGPNYTESLDLLHRSTGHLPVTDRPPAVPPGIVAGVLAHVAERLAMGEGLSGELAPETAPVSVGAIFDAAAASGVRTVLVRDTASADELPYPPETRARLRQAVEAGWLAVAPAEPVAVGGVPRVGWWLVEPVSGRTIDELDDGRGASMVGYAKNLIVSFLARHSYLRLGICIALVVKELKTLLELTSGGSSWSLGVGLGVGAGLGWLHHAACH
jgi:hypothetical protein